MCVGVCVFFLKVQNKKHSMQPLFKQKPTAIHIPLAGCQRRLVPFRFPLLPPPPTKVDLSSSSAQRKAQKGRRDVKGHFGDDNKSLRRSADTQSEPLHSLFTRQCWHLGGGDDPPENSSSAIGDASSSVLLHPITALGGTDQQNQEFAEWTCSTTKPILEVG